MNEMSVNWKRLGVIVVGLLSLAMLTCLILRSGADNRALQLAGIHSKVANTQSERRAPNSDRLLYENETLRFSLELPKTWEGYRVFELDYGYAGNESYGMKMVSLSLPVEWYAEDLMDPKDLDEGVFAVGIKTESKEYVEKMRAYCKEYVPAIHAYSSAIDRGETPALEGELASAALVCQSLYDPQSEFSPFIRQQYLGENDMYYFFSTPLEALDNGFKELPEGLLGEIAEVYKSFQAW